MSSANFSQDSLLPLRAVADATSAVSRAARGAGALERHAWRDAYVSRLVLFDLGCALVAIAAAYLVRFGPPEAWTAPATLILTVALPGVWLLALLLLRCYEEKFLWEGMEEFRRVIVAALLLLGGIALVSWAAVLELSRGFVLVALPLATALTLVHRGLQRERLRRQRAKGRFLQTTLLVGRPEGIAALHEQLRRESHYGYRVVGCCLPATGAGSRSFDGLPVLGGPDDVADVVRRFGVDTVAVQPSPELDGAALRHLGWELEKDRANLLLAPAATELVGPRFRIRPVCGLSLLQMERPELRGARRLVKSTFDRTGAAVLLLLLAPVLVASALAVKLESPGPVFFKQQRVGRDGRLFPMVKFRSMEVGADRVLDRLAPMSDGNGVLFKLVRDPRVTRAGKILRRYSLDELPQLFNVLKGDMSLVGPRPPLPTEVASYGVDMRRRLLVKPGLTGLWQVSGRSNLSWDESVRLDVHYVENWSLLLDLMILWRTVGAVLRGEGAY
ncbi:sugar transferase [Blastococcus sp. CT_GayMR20]|uniref:sugar transferase n=1 Tax=Blastococcus sp. CT_GayMR20 TaxID=2559609 RepID=UPI00107336FB|nr:sugar transferase [Blastococcus sp. CT_GayMR20]TFV92686.1 sugar transferase [Blastococcus sp. CT_GayMR20]TFV92732.1 sugar transferase [Blastococcus sp. CT_GayMR20]